MDQLLHPFCAAQGDHPLFWWCCYITVDSAMAASQNGFCSYNLSIHRKTNIMQIMTKNITIFNYLFFYHREIVKLDHFMTLSLSYENKKNKIKNKKSKTIGSVVAPFLCSSGRPSPILMVLLHNGGFCNGCITKRILLLQSFHS